jgi:plastocyanin
MKTIALLSRLPPGCCCSLRWWSFDSGVGLMAAGTGKALRSTASISIITAASTALALSGCGLSGPAHGPPAANVAAVVDMGFQSYDPLSVTIRTGDTVEWRNTSLITHTVTGDPTRAKSPGDAVLPPGAQSFDSGDIVAGQVYLRAFTVPGTYHYFCTRHEDDGMVGSVVVTPAP